MSTVNKQLEEALGNLDKLKPEQLNSLIEEAVKTFDSLQGKLHSNDPKDTKAAVESVKELKESLENQMNELLRNVGVNPEELKELMSNPANFAPEERSLIGQIDKEFKRFTSQSEEESSPKKMRKSKTEWIPG